MNAEWKQKWIDALESGKYEQGRLKLRKPPVNDQNLKRPETWCCLGVLCDIIDPTQWKQDSKGNWSYISGDHSYETILSVELHNLTKLNRAEQSALVGMNDDNISFIDIANYIKEKL